jgi:hypothetical protein
MTGEGHPRTGGWVATRSWHVTWPNAHGVGWGGVCPAAGTRSQPSMGARTRRMGSSGAPPPRSGAATYIESDSTRPSRSRGHAASSPPHPIPHARTPSSPPLPWCLVVRRRSAARRSAPITSPALPYSHGLAATPLLPESYLVQPPRCLGGTHQHHPAPSRGGGRGGLRLREPAAAIAVLRRPTTSERAGKAPFLL